MIISSVRVDGTDSQSRASLDNIGQPKWAFTGGFLLLRNFSVAISISPHIC